MTDLASSRYGQKSFPRWLRNTLIVVGLLILISWSVWGALANKDKPIGFQQQSYNVTSDHSVDISIEVYREGGKAAECSVYAQSHDHTIVGERIIEVPAGEETVIVSGTIETDRPAITAVVADCTLKP